jgi:NAD(P)-dependent dehydrogenase (short-subunit alcohol dehydrogenase family)
MTNDFRDKVALVTGGASGIGRVTAQAFGREGAKVVVTTDANVNGAEETVQSIRSAGGEGVFIKCDVSRAADVEALIEGCVRTYGRLDYAFNNAGIGPDGKRQLFYSTVDTPEDVWDRTMNVNLKGVWLCMKYEIRQMLRQKFGAIVNNSSLGGWRPKPGFSAYGASKSGVISLTQTAALEYAEFGIRINVILPGPTARTGLMNNMMSADPERSHLFSDAVPMKRIAEPEEAAQAVIWLCSDAASFITGHAMPIDGGLAL